MRISVPVARSIGSILLLVQMGCAGTAAYVLRESNDCPQAEGFGTYAVCVDNLLAASSQPEAVRLRQQLPTIADAAARLDISEKAARAWVREKLAEWYQRESDDVADVATAVAVTAVVVGGALLLGSASSSSSGSSGSTGGQSLQGCCSWHKGVSHCGYTGYVVCRDTWVSSCACR